MEKVTFLVTNGCNFKCKHCFVDAGNKMENELSVDEKFKAINKLCELGVKKITFSGGEPLIDREVFRYIEYVKNKGLKIGFLTNGLLLDKEKLIFLKRMVDTFSISLYTQDILGINQEMYNRYLDKTIHNLINLSEMHFKFNITIPVSTMNKDKAIELIKMLYAKKIKSNTVRIYMITPIGRGEENKDICTPELNCVELLERLPKDIRDSDFDISVEYSSVDKNSEDNLGFCTYCTILNYSSTNYINNFGDPHMDVNGDLYLCGLILRKKEYCIGNILRDSKEEIVKNIDKVVEMIKRNKGEDCCPALKRKTNENQKLVCPVIYLRSEVKKEGK